MDVTIIIPNYNRRNLIGYTLDSLAPEQHPGVELEIIVVDDHSVDGSIDFISQTYPNVIVVLNKSKGAAAARNSGLELATADYVLYLDSDDLLGPGFLVTKLKYLNANRSVLAVYGAYKFFNSGGAFNFKDVIFKHPYPVPSGISDSALHLRNYLRGAYLPPNCIVWRRSLLLNIKGHNESLAINQDVDLFVRALLYGMNPIFVEDNTFALIRAHNLDQRVGSASGFEAKYVQMLELRVEILATLRAARLDTPELRIPLAQYLLDIWRDIHNKYPNTAERYFELARQVYWPIPLAGGVVFRFIGRVLGPKYALNLKDRLTKKRPGTDPGLP